MIRLCRVAIYLRTMFPLHTNVLGSFLMFASFYLLAQRTTGDGAVQIGPTAALGAVSVLLATLLARLFDDMKDREADRVFFPDRPLVTGAVQYEDVHLLAAVVGPALVILNAWGGAVEFFLPFFVFLLLSWRWFFLPGIVPPNLCFVFITHQPLVPLLYLWVYGIVLRDTGRVPEPASAALLLTAYWPAMIAWELARKIRAPEQETTYKTYSSVFGPRRAAIGVVGCLGLSTALLMVVAIRFDLSWYFTGLEAAAAAIVSAPFIAFALEPIASRARLVRWIEMYVLAFHLGIIAECLR